MAFRAIRNSRNTRWTQKLGEIFQDHDKDKSGTISVKQMQDIYKFYQVELNSDDVKAISINGQIKKIDFIEYALETKLLDLTDTSNARKTVNTKSVQQKRPSVARRKKIDNSKDDGGLLCCVKKRKRPKIIEFDRVESAFRRLDINNDGVLDWNEFKKVTKDLDEEQALRIFKSCDQNGDHKITLEEFRTMANLKLKQ